MSHPSSQQKRGTGTPSGEAPSRDASEKRSSDRSRKPSERRDSRQERPARGRNERSGERAPQDRNGQDHSKWGTPERKDNRPARGRDERSGQERPGRGNSERQERPSRGRDERRFERPALGQDRQAPGRRNERAPLGLEPEPRVVHGHALCRPLFVPLDDFSRNALEILPKALDRVLPLSRAHRADLPEAIRDLSALLTYERAGLGRSYWSAPRFVSAYLRYFLPWNLVRLARLFPGLDIPAPVCDESHPLSIADLGSGPLTLPLALWLSRPDWRALPLTVVCVDTVPRPMELGRSLLEAVADLCGEPLRWKIQLVRSPLMRSFRELRSPHLIMAGNVLNELKDKPGTSLDERMAELAGTLERNLHPEGAALFVEPGTRLGGTLTAKLRETAMEEGLMPVAPCPHLGECPLLDSRRWCHATQDAGGPVWLAGLARDAKLPKDSLSLAFMLLRPEAVATPPTKADLFPSMDVQGVVGRVLSDAFPVPGMGFARYACTEEGFAIIPAAGGLPSGALVACRHPQPPRKDAKTGAIELLWQAETKPQR